MKLTQPRKRESIYYLVKEKYGRRLYVVVCLQLVVLLSTPVPMIHSLDGQQPICDYLYVCQIFILVMLNTHET